MVQALASILDQLADPDGFANGVTLRPGKRAGSRYRTALPEIVGAFFGWSDLNVSSEANGSDLDDQ
ncbi:MAG: hypothetical protein H7288_12330 [Kineosporiaceae bacterium]|nr:hypothetical protein [Aeromicrobium sp.]